MNWFILALLAPALYTIVNYIDKYVIENKVKDYRGMPIYGAITGLVIGTLFWFFAGRPILDLRDSTLVLASGIFSLFAYYLYFNALSKNQTSYVIILFQMVPIFTLILAFSLLGEHIFPRQLLGFVFIIVASVILSLEGKLEKFKLSSAFYLIFVADILLAFAAILIKFTINVNSFTKIFSYESWGLAIGGLILFILFQNVRKAFKESFKTVGNNVLTIMFLNEIVFVVSKAVGFLAISLGPVALVSVLGSTQALYGIVYGIILTLIAPKIFKEEIGRRHLLKKFVCALIMLLGILLIG